MIAENTTDHESTTENLTEKQLRERINKPNKFLSINEQIAIFEQKTNLSFPDFYVKYLPKLIYYNYKICKDIQLSEDLATDSVIKALGEIDGYDNTKSRITTWLFTIAKRDTLQYIKKKPPVISFDTTIDADGTTLKEYIPSKEVEEKEENEVRLINIEKGKILKDKISLLKEPYKKVLTLREIDKHSYRNISILLAEQKETLYDLNRFCFEQETNILTMTDPESKTEFEIPKWCEIHAIKTRSGECIEFEILSRDKDNLIDSVLIKSSNAIPNMYFYIEGVIPFNISTLKSQIRGGRLLLMGMVKNEFEELDNTLL